MSGPWHCERDDAEGLYVYDARDHPGLGMGGDMMGHATELEAWEYGLDVLVGRRALLTDAIKSARAEVRRLKRRMGRAGEGRSAPD